MTRHDRRTLFTALAFLAFLLKGGNNATESRAARITKLAGLFENFCDENVPVQPSIPEVSFDEEKGTSGIDADLERHKHNLKINEQTRLPDDRESLLKFYDRLQQRRARRLQRNFYANAAAEKIADIVLRYLDEEIEDAEGLS